MEHIAIFRRKGQEGDIRLRFRLQDTERGVDAAHPKGIDLCHKSEIVANVERELSRINSDGRACGLQPRTERDKCKDNRNIEKIGGQNGKRGCHHSLFLIFERKQTPLNELKKEKRLRGKKKEIPLRTGGAIRLFSWSSRGCGEKSIKVCR